MGFLRRILGGAGKTRGMHLTATSFDVPRDDAAVSVVGEAYRQGNVASARRPAPGDLPPGLPAPPPGYFKAILIPEPTNQYDPNAIAVFLWAGGTWAQGGYLSRSDAVAYQPVFAHLALSDSGTQRSIACDAARVPERGGIGIILHLGTPAECVVELVTTDRTATADHPWVNKPIAFTGQSMTAIHGVPIDRFGQVQVARWASCEVLPRLTKKASALVVADPQEVTGNFQRARDYGVPLVEEPAFLVAIGVPAEFVTKVSGRWAHG